MYAFANNIWFSCAAQKNDKDVALEVEDVLLNLAGMAGQCGRCELYGSDYIFVEIAFQGRQGVDKRCQHWKGLFD